jgi:thiamine biosynthesis protein ThiI
VETLTAHYHEIALKGRNRSRFEQVLRGNIARAMRGLAPTRVRPSASRILVETEADPEEVAARLLRVFGVAHVMRVRRFPRELEAVGAALVEDAKKLDFSTFRVSARRSDKGFPLTSVEVERKLGAIVHHATGKRVRLKGADLEIHVMVLPAEILASMEKRAGPGGLPVGTSGRVLALLSGGIDSPVAAWRMMRRGCRVDLLHFHSRPLVDATTEEKARDLAEALTPWQLGTRLYLAPLAQVQTEVKLKTPDPLRVVLYRRFMIRIAERIARHRACRAVVTGESLGQVASQTLENLSVVDAVATMPVLRPLIGNDKLEISNEAERIGTIAISNRPDQDCCQLFLPERPVTRAKLADVEAAEAALDVEGLVEDAFARSETVHFAWPR